MLINILVIKLLEIKATHNHQRANICTKKEG